VAYQISAIVWIRRTNDCVTRLLSIHPLIHPSTHPHYYHLYSLRYICKLSDRLVRSDTCITSRHIL